jgi:hypothetical protein
MQRRRRCIGRLNDIGFQPGEIPLPVPDFHLRKQRANDASVRVVSARIEASDGRSGVAGATLTRGVVAATFTDRHGVLAIGIATRQQRMQPVAS